MHKEITWILKEKYSGKPNKSFYKDIKRLKAGKPLDYIIGFTNFLGCKIDLSKKPLIPRPETEYWTEKAIAMMSRDLQSFTNRGTRILDMFAGSGCIGVSIMRHSKNVAVVFAEKNKKAVQQIKINIKLNEKTWADSRELVDKENAYSNVLKNIRVGKCKVIQSDVFSNVVGKYDYIFANPPYIPDYRNNPSARLRTILRNRIQKSVLNYEPHGALFGGVDGLMYIRKFLAEAKNFLNPGGQIYMEFDSIQKNSIEKLLEKFRYKQWKFYKDQYKKWRYVVIE